jgi:hypothetical protein
MHRFARTNSFNRLIGLFFNRVFIRVPLPFRRFHLVFLFPHFASLLLSNFLLNCFLAAYFPTVFLSALHSFCSSFFLLFILSAFPFNHPKTSTVIKNCASEARHTKREFRRKSRPAFDLGFRIKSSCRSVG